MNSLVSGSSLHFWGWVWFWVVFQKVPTLSFEPTSFFLHRHLLVKSQWPSCFPWVHMTHGLCTCSSLCRQWSLKTSHGQFHFYFRYSLLNIISSNWISHAVLSNIETLPQHITHHSLTPSFSPTVLFTTTWNYVRSGWFTCLSLVSLGLINYVPCSHQCSSEKKELIEHICMCVCLYISYTQKEVLRNEPT